MLVFGSSLIIKVNINTQGSRGLEHSIHELILSSESVEAIESFENTSDIVISYRNSQGDYSIDFRDANSING
jgi:hypothetical protein